MRTFAFAIAMGLLGVSSEAAEPNAVRGDYLEARNADVFTGPCFSNSEIFIVGNRAVMAWKVNEGSWNGVRLNGLTVAAAVKASNTFQEDRPEKAASVVLVDQQANDEQREALVDMARHLGQGRLEHIVAVKPVRLTLTVESRESGHEAEADHHGMPRAPLASLWSPGLATIVTRPLGEDDHVCGNEVVAYRPLSEGTDVLPAYTIGHSFQGEGLNTRWSNPNARSSFVGHFAY